jgi:hypothetical protein
MARVAALELDLRHSPPCHAGFAGIARIPPGLRIGVNCAMLKS